MKLFKGHHDAVVCMRITEWGLFTGSKDYTLRRWDVHVISSSFHLNQFTGWQVHQHVSRTHDSGQVYGIRFELPVQWIGGCNSESVVHRGTSIA